MRQGFSTAEEEGAKPGMEKDGKVRGQNSTGRIEAGKGEKRGILGTSGQPENTLARGNLGAPARNNNKKGEKSWRQRKRKFSRSTNSYSVKERCSKTDGRRGKQGVNRGGERLQGEEVEAQVKGVSWGRPPR